LIKISHDRRNKRVTERVKNHKQFSLIEKKTPNATRKKIATLPPGYVSEVLNVDRNTVSIDNNKQSFRNKSQVNLDKASFCSENKCTLQGNMPNVKKGQNIVAGRQLNHGEINVFIRLLETFSDNQSVHTYCMTELNKIPYILPSKKHIQILYSCGKSYSSVHGHWVCSFYCEGKVFIYDSMQFNKLHEFHRPFLSRLHPYIDLENSKSVSFPLVEKQPDINDSGIYAIAYAVSLIYGLQPEHIRYDKTEMHSHLMNMLRHQRIEQFPCEVVKESNNIPVIKPPKCDKREGSPLSKLSSKVIIIDGSSVDHLSLNHHIVCHESPNKNERQIKINNPTIVANFDTKHKFFQEHIINSGEMLNDDHINDIGGLLQMRSDYRPAQTYWMQRPDKIPYIPPNKKHIQILFSCMCSGNHHRHCTGGHWICSYYDTKNIFIYNSIKSKKLHKHHKIFLNRLHPYINLLDAQSVQFPMVQQQTNAVDCGVFAIAFAVTLSYGLKPENITYNETKMRPHLLNMLKRSRIEHFPQNLIVESTVPLPCLPLQVVKPTSTSLQEMLTDAQTVESGKFAIPIDNQVRELVINTSINQRINDISFIVGNETVKTESHIVPRNVFENSRTSSAMGVKTRDRVPVQVAVNST